MPHESDDSAGPSGKAMTEQREARLLAQLEQARRRDGDELAARRLTAELLAPYWNYTLRIARWKLHGVAATEADVEDVAANVLERMVRALANTTHFTKALKYVVLDNVDWACADFRRQRQRRGAETLCPPDELAPSASPVGRKRSTVSGGRDAIGSGNGEGPDGDGLAAQARRFFAAASPAEIARELGMSRGALDTATHRALRKLMASEEMADVRNARGRPEGEAA